MKRKFVKSTVLCVALVALMALAVAPIASATAEFTEVSAIETVEVMNPITPQPWVTGGVAHWGLDNVLRETSTSPLLAGHNHTHVLVLFDPQTGAGTMYGTWRIVLDAGVGVWEGRFAGSISVATGAADIHITGKGVSGMVAGMILRGCDVNATGASGVVTATIIAPQGF